MPEEQVRRIGLPFVSEASKREVCMYVCKVGAESIKRLRVVHLLLCSKRWWVCMENVLTVEGTSLHRILVSITQSCLAHVGVSKLHTLDIVLLLDEHVPVL